MIDLKISQIYRKLLLGSDHTVSAKLIQTPKLMHGGSSAYWLEPRIGSLLLGFNPSTVTRSKSLNHFNPIVPQFSEFFYKGNNADPTLLSLRDLRIKYY